ncbi:DUF4129 domain-containing protein [Bacillus sp. JJ1764]|uniref:DUF4129 domain-containing protein n=1 Tax=Bacillus sp. JJ1764 TaxID=3122964 RepID=UPI002FFDE928
MLDAHKAKDDLQQILSEEEYRVYYNQTKGFIETWWEKAKDWIAKQLEKILPSIDSANGAAGPVLIGVIVVTIILLVIIALFLVRNVKRNRILKGQKPLQSMKEINWSYSMHLQEAGTLEAQGRYEQATRHLFLALLLYFHEKEWLEARIWKTNWDYYEELRKINKHCADQFYDLAAFFDEVTYGERTITKEEFDQFRTRTFEWLEQGPTHQEGRLENRS